MSNSLSRREIQQRKQALIADLRAAYRQGGMASGDIALSRRELSLRYGLSTRTISIELEQLIQEGILYSVPRVGTFIGRPKDAALESYLIILPFTPLRGDFCHQALTGFEEKVAQLGGAALAFIPDEALKHRAEGDLPPLAGVFELGTPKGRENWGVEGVPYVRFDDTDVEKASYDMIHFDDVQGGRQAAQHMLRMGHQHVAFLGVHVPDSGENEFTWSAKRAQGWREVMNNAGLAAPEFHPSVMPPVRIAGSQIRMGLEAATRLIKHPGITAVIAANVTMAESLFMALNSAGIPASRWPAVLCFDDATEVNGTVVSSVRLPWDTLGRAAAELLWERRNGRLTGGVHKRLVPMALIPRLTCRQDWGLSSGLAQQHIEQLSAVSPL